MIRSNIILYSVCEILELLIRNGVDPKEKDKLEQSALFYTAKEGKSMSTQLLIDNGSDVNDIDINGQTAIFYAAR